MKNYFEEFYNRYEDLKGGLEEVVGDLSSDENLKKALNIHNEELKSDTEKIEGELSSDENQKNKQLLNNLIMAGLGMGTLYLRMGAIIMIAEELAKPDNEKNISFLKVIADNLVPKPPNDGEWTNIWVKHLELNTNSIWNNLINEANNHNQNIPKIKFNIGDFVEFRNNIAHQKIILGVDYLKQIKEGFNALRVMAKFKDIFINCSFEENTQLVFFSKELAKPINVWPYIRVDEENKKEAIGKQPYQPSVEGILPYLFSGKYYQGVKFINTQGGESNKEQDEDIEDNFKEIQKVITNFNGDKAFNFDEKTSNYNDWFIGREDEVKAISDWIDNSETEKNVLPIFASAGLGKGALVAKVIENLKEKNIKHLFHYCGYGAANNLQAILYGLIIQGGWDKDFNKIINEDKKSIWNVKNLSPKLQNRFARFPTQYIDVIELFQALLDSTEPESEPLKEITDKDFDEALETNDAKGKELNTEKRLSNISKLLIKLTEFDLHSKVGDVLIQLEVLIKKADENSLKGFYPILYDIHNNLNKHNFENNLLSYIPKDLSQVSNTDNKIKKEVNSKLVIIIDGLDEASVADHSKRISDWFYTYKDDAPNADDIRSKRADKWISPKHIKWIFTFRYSKDESKKIKQYDYPNEIKAEFNIEENESLQPLKPLNITAEELNKALMIDLKENMNENAPTLTDAFINAILEKGKIKDDKAESALK